eukprot:s497_g11.t1
MARTSLLSKALLVVGVVSVLQLFRREDAFVTPKPRGEAAATMAAALLAASVAAPGPAQAESPKLSFFGLGGGVQSDVYNQNDNPINPYSQFSEVGDESVYKARTDQEARVETTVARRKKALTNSFERFDKTADMVYFSGAEGSPAYNKAREFSQKISTVGVDGRNKESWLFLWGVREREEWGRASQDFEAAKELLKEWKELVKNVDPGRDPLLPNIIVGVNYGLSTGTFRGWRPIFFAAASPHAEETAVEAAELLVEAGTVAYVTRACSDDDHLKHREDSRQRQSFLLPGYKYYHVSTFYNSGRS